MPEPAAHYLDAILAASRDHIIIGTDSRGAVTLFNPGAEQALRYRAEEVLGSFTLAAFHDLAELESLGMPTTGPQMLAALMSSAVGANGGTREWTYVRKDGSRLPVSLSVAAVQDGCGGIVGYVAVARDLTERRDHAETIGRLSRQGELILRAAGEGIIGLDREGRMTFVNPAAGRILGYPVAELVGRRMHELVHHAHADGTPYPAGDCPILAALRDGAAHRVAGEVFWRRDGTPLPVEYVSTPLRAGPVTGGAVVIFQDVTERRRDEERRATLLREATAAEARFRGLLESSPDATVITTSAGEIMFLNRQAELLFGYERDELMGRPVEVLVPVALRQAHTAHRGRYAAHPQTRPMGIGMELHAVRKDGSAFPTEISLAPVRSGEDVIIIAVVRDITERKRAEEALRESEERFRLLVQHVKDYAIFLLTPDGHVATWNDGAERLKGYAASEIIGQHFSLFYPAEDVAAGAPSRAIEVAASEGRFEAEGLRVRKDGSRFWAHVVLTALRDSSGRLRGFAEVTRDVTAQRELERQKDEFLANVSHDLRTPLAAIKASIGVVLANEPPDMPAPIRRLHANIDAAATRMAALVDDLLELTRLQAGRAALRLERADLGALARRVAQGVEPLAERRGQRLELAVPARPVWAMVDPGRLERALLNLVGNAQKYGREGGRIRVSVEARDGEARIAVADDGPGIPPEERGRIFERFYRAGAGAEARSDGTGLGLPIARGIAELHGGRLELESAVGAGSTFTLALPRRAREGAAGARGGPARGPEEREEAGR